MWVILGDLTDRRHGKSATDGTAMGPGRGERLWVLRGNRVGKTEIVPRMTVK